MSMSPDGKRLLTAGSDNVMRLWETATGQELRSYEGHTEPVRCAAFSPDGSWALSTSGDKTMRLWVLPR